MVYFSMLINIPIICHDLILFKNFYYKIKTWLESVFYKFILNLPNL